EERFLLGSREEAAHASIDVYSPTSPLGGAVIGRKVGSEVTYKLPRGERSITVTIVATEAYSG
ncbi:MAG: GreA/GreB family elongation factor, partial [Actinomycetes bacterium]